MSAGAARSRDATPGHSALRARPRRSPRALALLALAALGTAVSGYLTWIHYSGSLALCTGSGGCETVQASRYSEVAGVPVAALGLALYACILALTAWGALSGRAPSAAVLALFALSFAGTLYSGYLTYLELYVIRAICPWCVTSAVVMTAIWLLSLPGLRHLT